ncbi:MAG TPA: glycosyltransferase [Chitinophagales bacterium]|nr:glycosyltransferase [Chitinophagales bacterium]
MDKIFEYIFYTAVSIQVFYYGILFMRIHFSRQKTKIDNNPHLPVSVIICAYNEAENLKRYLPAIFNQQYSDFEVLVVNDGSTDATAQVLTDLQIQYPILKIITILPEEKKHLGKKYALNLGIQQASHPYLLLTDADCEVVSENWISNMVQYLDVETEMVLGIAPYYSTGTFLSKMVSYETTLTMIQYINYALWGMPYMGVGRNLAYTKKLYNKVGGMESHQDIISGDDDLFVQSATKHTQVAVCMNKDTFMYSEAPQNFKNWWNQKIRHYSTGSHYQWWQQLLLGGFIITKWTVYVFFMLLIVTNSFQWAYIYALICYLFIFNLFMNSVKNKFSTHLKWHEVFFFDIAYIVTIVIQGIHSKNKQKINW